MHLGIYAFIVEGLIDHVSFSCLLVVKSLQTLLVLLVLVFHRANMADERCFELELFHFLDVKGVWSDRVIRLELSHLTFKSFNWVETFRHLSTDCVN